MHDSFMHELVEHQVTSGGRPDCACAALGGTAATSHDGGYYVALVTAPAAHVVNTSA
jgi:hypothetical protein